MQRRIPLSCLLMVFMLLMFTTAAQEDDNIGSPDTLLETLALIPDTPQARAGILSYADYRAMETARPGAAQPTSFEEFNEVSDSIFGGLWMAAVRGISSGSSQLMQNFMLSEEMPRVLGIDFFDIDQSVEYGNPPEQGTILSGRFDLEAVQAALIEREYEATEIEHGTIWCGTVGCENGTDTDLQGREPANPFGGHLGQQQPLLISDSYLVGSPNLTNIENHAAVLEDAAPSLADNAVYAVVAEALDADGILIQAQFMQPELVLDAAMRALLSSFLTAEEPEDIYEQLEQDFVAFPLYELLAITDSVVDRQQVVQVMLVYSDADDAQAAADAIPQRIAGYTSTRTQQPMPELLEDREMQYETSVFSSDEHEKAVAVVTFTAPVASNIPAQGTGLTQSSMAFRLLIQMVYAGDLGWLLPELPLLEEISGD